MVAYVINGQADSCGDFDAVLKHSLIAFLVVTLVASGNWIQLVF